MQENITENQVQQPSDDALSAPSAFEADLTDLRTENDRLRTELRVRTARDEMTRLLAADRARSPELLFEASANRLDFDDNGRLKNTSELIAELKHRFPEQFSAEKEMQLPAPVLPEPGPPQQHLRSAWTQERWPTTAEVVGVPVINAGAGRTGSRLPLTKEALAAMSPREILKLDWNAVKQVMES